jgi:lysophospholipase L1-like esterase
MDSKLPVPRRFQRYVAIGDSSTEGLDDPDGQGGYRGWANRLAERIAAAQGSLLYANLGVRGLRTRQIRESQLAPALAMQPDLVTLFSGTNDAVSRAFDPRTVEADIVFMHRALIAQGATVVSFTLPDLEKVLPFGRWLSPRVSALNDAIRSACGASGAVLVDFAAHPVASDLRLWSHDRFHANALGHTLISHALAHALGVAGADDGWKRPFDAGISPARGGGTASWVVRHFIPWAWRHARGRSSGDGRLPKRPRLESMTPA